ncbi:MAG: hypothetical protein IKM61_05560 [Eubacteriaceae bacterium]|nr:hypothetical protein [Eubacteriaceae bacterium]
MASVYEHYHKGDINLDGKIEVGDLSILLHAYCSDNEVSDINDDGVVNSDDVSLLLSWYGTERTKY